MSDFRTTAGESVPLTPRQARTRMKKRVFYSFCVLVIVAVLLAFIRVNQTVPATGYVTTDDYAEARAHRSGRIKDIRVKTGMVVAEGDVLAVLDDAEAEALLEQAEKQAERVAARIESLRAVHKDKRAMFAKSLALAELRFASAVSKLELAKRLSARGLASDISVEDNRLARDLAQVELEALKSADQTLDEKEMAVLLEEKELADKAVNLQRIRLEECLIRAPVAGKVIRHEFVIGEVVAPDMVLYEIFGGKGFVLKLMVAERHAALVQSGQKYRARLVPFGGLKRIWFTGEIRDVKDVIETRGKQTGRLVYCDFNPGVYDVQPGCSADAELFVGRAPLWRVLLGVY